MSSISSPSSPASVTRAGSFPFDSYAKLVRMLIPSVTKVGFYDPRGYALWLSDDLDEPELRTNVEFVMERIDTPEPARLPSDAGFRVLPIRDATHVHGALALVLDHSPASGGYRRSGAVERLLAPLLTTVAHAWSLAPPAATRRLNPDAATSRRAAIIGPAACIVAARRVATRSGSAGVGRAPQRSDECRIHCDHRRTPAGSHPNSSPFRRLRAACAKPRACPRSVGRSAL